MRHRGSQASQSAPQDSGFTVEEEAEAAAGDRTQQEEQEEEEGGPAKKKRKVPAYQPRTGTANYAFMVVLYMVGQKGEGGALLVLCGGH